MIAALRPQAANSIKMVSTMFVIGIARWQDKAGLCCCSGGIRGHLRLVLATQPIHTGRDDRHPCSYNFCATIMRQPKISDPQSWESYRKNNSRTWRREAGKASEKVVHFSIETSIKLQVVRLRDRCHTSTNCQSQSINHVCKTSDIDAVNAHFFVSGNRLDVPELLIIASEPVRHDKPCI